MSQIKNERDNKMKKSERKEKHFSNLCVPSDRVNFVTRAWETPPFPSAEVICVGYFFVISS